MGIRNSIICISAILGTCQGLVTAEAGQEQAGKSINLEIKEGAYYINGEAAGTPGSGINLGGVTNTAPVTIGNINETNRFYQGMIDEVYIYRRALTAEEVAGLASQ